MFDDPASLLHAALGFFAAAVGGPVAAALTVAFLFYEALTGPLKGDCPAADAAEFLAGGFLAVVLGA